jgi:hypothetical protein
MPTYAWSVPIEGQHVSFVAEAESLHEARQKLRAVIAADYAEHEAQPILTTITHLAPIQVWAKQRTETPPVKLAGKPRKVVWIGTSIAAVVAGWAAWGAIWQASPSSGMHYYASGSPELTWIMIVLAAAATLAVFCILFGVHFIRTGDSDDATLYGAKLRLWKVCLLAFWVIVPPLWFSYEYFYLYPQPGPRMTDEEKTRQLEEFVHGQENSSKVWIALVTALTGLYFGKQFSAKSEE